MTSNEKNKCTNCPECGCLYSVHCRDDELGEGYRICNQCGQEWWTDIDYDNATGESDDK